MFYDDLPIWGFIGKVEKVNRKGKTDILYSLFQHIHFDISYNGNRVIDVNVSTDPAKAVDITEGDKIIVDYSYSVKWKAVNTPFEQRMTKYARYSFLPQHLEVRIAPPRPVRSIAIPTPAAPGSEFDSCRNPSGTRCTFLSFPHRVSETKRWSP
jgi:hypothetical protein